MHSFPPTTAKYLRQVDREPAEHDMRQFSTTMDALSKSNQLTLHYKKYEKYQHWLQWSVQYILDKNYMPRIQLGSLHPWLYWSGQYIREKIHIPKVSTGLSTLLVILQCSVYQIETTYIQDSTGLSTLLDLSIHVGMKLDYEHAVSYRIGIQY